MGKINFKNLRHVYGMDNGNGNMMAYRIDMRVSPEKRTREPIVDKEGEPAGFSLTSNGKIQLGKQLEGTDYSSFSECQILPVNFKAIPTAENRDMMICYLKGWLDQMKKNCSSIEEDGQEAVWFIGCPNGWKSKKILDAYRDIFLEAGYVNPVIVPESNAAMMHFLVSNKDIEAESLKHGVMCVDAGAYSNDGTDVRPGKVASEGSFVGASIIEKEIVSANLYSEHLYRQGKKPYNDPELTEAVRKRFEEDQVFRSFMLLQGRWLKEQYFTKKKNNTLPAAGRDYQTQIYLDDYPDFDGQMFFNMFINTKMVEDLVANVPIRVALGEFQFGKLSEETQKEIGDYTWKQCFENFLHRLADTFPEFKERAMAESGPKAVVILTGGASQMDFIPVTIEEVFENAYVYVDRTPILSIAMGLTDFAPEKLRAMAFDQAFSDILDEEIIDEDGDAIPCVLKWLSDAYDKFCIDSCKAIALNERNNLVDATKAWAEHEYSSNVIGKNAGEKFTAQFDKEVLPGMRKDSKEANEMLLNSINERFRDLLIDSGLQNTTLFADGEMHLEFTDIVIKDLMPAIQKAVLETYSGMQEKLFDNLPNPGRFNLLQPSRIDILKAIAESLDEILEKVWEDTLKFLGNVFYDDDIRKAFMYEALYEIQEELNKKKRTLLGDLIVEESYDDNGE